MRQLRQSHPPRLAFHPVGHSRTAHACIGQLSQKFYLRTVEACRNHGLRSGRLVWPRVGRPKSSPRRCFHSRLAAVLPSSATFPASRKIKVLALLPSAEAEPYLYSSAQLSFRTALPRWAITYIPMSRASPKPGFHHASSSVSYTPHPSFPTHTKVPGRCTAFLATSLRSSIHSLVPPRLTLASRPSFHDGRVSCCAR